MVGDGKETRSLDVLTFGETMLRLAAPGYGRLEEAVSLDVRIGGSESNTAVGLARLGLRVGWGSKLPANPLGRRIENEIRRWGVDTSGVIWDGSPEARAGLYFLDFGLAPRGTDVYYDRADSSLSTLTPDELNGDAIADARLLHLTGITPALSPGCAASAARAIQLAQTSGTKVSFDVNYRAKLWSPEVARAALETLLPSVNLLLCPLRDAATIFQLSGDGPTVARLLKARFGIETVVVTCGADGTVASDDQGDYVTAPFADFPQSEPLHRVGSGDAFNAGVLMGYLQDDLQTGLAYGTTMAALKHTMPGDLLLATRAEIEAALTGASLALRR